MNKNTNKKINILSTCTLNYVPYALIALRTCMKYCPSVRANLFIADGTGDAVKELNTIARDFDLDLNIFIPDDLSLNLQELYLPCFAYYNAFEISNVAKYVGIKHVISESQKERCIYIDADMCFYGDIIDAIEQDSNSPIILSSHQLLHQLTILRVNIFFTDGSILASRFLTAATTVCMKS